MKKYAKVIDEKTKLCEVGLADNVAYYISQGMAEQDVEQAYNGQWYLVGHAPAKPEPTLKEQLEQKEKEYQMNRWQREIILSANSGASDYNKQKAQELENIAEQIRNLEANNE